MIIIGWSELPSYAVDCINFLKLKKKLIILTDNKKANKLIKNSKVKIINLSQNYTWEDIGITNPKYFFFTGWNNKAFISLAKQKKTKNICLVDNVLKKNLRQFFGKIYFKIFLEKIFDAIFVPGKHSKNLIKYFGFKKSIFQGLYTGNNKIFRNRIIITKRKYDFIYVGKFIERKNLNILLGAFNKIKNLNIKVNLLLVGGKKQKSKNDVEVIPFSNSKRVAKLMGNSKCLILPSLEENWGVVVHESSCCGCLLILSNKVGAREEFLNKNGYEFDPNNQDDLILKMRKVLNLNKQDLQKKSYLSEEMSKKRSIQNWKEQFFKIIKKLN